MYVLLGIQRDSLRATVLNPAGVTESCDIVDVDQSETSSEPDRVVGRQPDTRTYGIRFTPSQIGVHTVSVTHMQQTIPGMLISSSPCHVVFFSSRFVNVQIFDGQVAIYRLNHMM